MDDLINSIQQDDDDDDHFGASSMAQDHDETNDNNDDHGHHQQDQNTSSAQPPKQETKNSGWNRLRARMGALGSIKELHERTTANFDGIDIDQDGTLPDDLDDGFLQNDDDGDEDDNDDFDDLGSDLDLDVGEASTKKFIKTNNSNPSSRSTTPSLLSRSSTPNPKKKGYISGLTSGMFGAKDDEDTHEKEESEEEDDEDDGGGHDMDDFMNSLSMNGKSGGVLAKSRNVFEDDDQEKKKKEKVKVSKKDDDDDEFDF
ncbi:hypothetical protein AKO1_002125 [Acrasis kona]|uniref:Uncharacterized protein n=1 Tax=Acrasis kona TaxID=1008807 RepID=A0AAW2ZAE3_9EUKA